MDEPLDLDKLLWAASAAHIINVHQLLPSWHRPVHAALGLSYSAAAQLFLIEPRASPSWAARQSRCCRSAHTAPQSKSFMVLLQDKCFRIVAVIATSLSYYWFHHRLYCSTAR